MARAGKVEALMKGALHTDELMDAVVDSAMRPAHGAAHQPRLRYGRAGLSAPAVHHRCRRQCLPELDDKLDIVQNAIDLAHALGIAEPKVAILSAVETVTAKIRSTLDAAALCKMADRGQITGGILDGPLAFDNAVIRGGRQTKGIVSAVAGQADILRGARPRVRQHAGQAARVPGRRESPASCWARACRSC